jgi:hypothetical protein
MVVVVEEEEQGQPIGRSHHLLNKQVAPLRIAVVVAEEEQGQPIGRSHHLLNKQVAPLRIAAVVAVGLVHRVGYPTPQIALVGETLSKQRCDYVHLIRRPPQSLYPLSSTRRCDLAWKFLV